MNPQENGQPVHTASPGATAAQIPTEKIGKFKASRMIVKESWEILKKDKELAWFPVISSITTLVALLVMGALFFFVIMAGNINAFDTVDEQGMDVIGYAVLLVYYLVLFFISNYFLAGMYIIINGRFNGQDLSFRDGMRGARDNFNKIFVWSLISATVGVVLRIITDKFEIAGKIVAAILGAAWNILTYFSLPSLIIGKTSIKDSFKDSAAIIRKTWGETIIVNFGVGFVFGLLMFFGIALAIGLAILVSTIEFAIFMAVILVLYIIVLSIISSTLGSIFKLALYQYAKTGTVPQGFTPALVQGAVKSKK